MASRSPHSHRRRKGNSGRLGLAGVVTGVVAIGVVAAGFILLRPDGDGAGQPGLTGGVTQGSAQTGPAPATGAPLTISTPEGYRYSVAAVRRGIDPRPLKDSSPADGTTYAYADYVLSNRAQQPILLDYPADLFIKRSQVPEGAQARCMPQPGVPGDMCTLPTKSQVTTYLNGSKPPITQDADTLIPAGASYLVRIATDLPVNTSATPSDIGLYVWNVRFTTSGRGVEVPFP